MKKNIFILFSLSFFVSFLFSAEKTYAISGACSYHGGVNCSVGASLYGNAICNDGWESSTSYYLTDECSDSFFVNKCPYPIPLGCSDSSQLSLYQSMVTADERMGGNGLAAASKVAQCQQEITDYNNKIQAHNKCMIDEYGYDAESGKIVPSKAQRDSASDVACSNADSNSSYDTTSQKCTCNSGSVPNAQGKCELVVPASVIGGALPVAIVGQKYAADIPVVYAGNAVPVLRLSNIPDSFQISYLSINSVNGFFHLELLPRVVGEFTFNADIVTDDVVVGRQVFTLTVKDKNQTALPASITPDPTETPAINVNQIILSPSLDISIKNQPLRVSSSTKNTKGILPTPIPSPNSNPDETLYFSPAVTVITTASSEPVVTPTPKHNTWFANFIRMFKFW